MKTIVLALLFPLLSAAQTVSLMDSPPSTANLSQPFAFNTDGQSPAALTEGTQARFQASGSNTLRSVTQTFTWNTSAPLTGLGIMVAPDQNAPGGCPFVRAQNYALDIQELDAANAVVSTVASATVALTPAVVKPGKYMHFTFGVPVPLGNGKTYGIHLRPVAVDRANRLLAAFSGYTSAGGKGLIPGAGFGAQTGGYYDARAGTYTALPAGTRYASNRGGGYSHTYYATTGDAISPAAASFAAVAPAPAEVTIPVNTRAVKRVIVSEPDSYFTYPHENGFWQPDGEAGGWVLVVVNKQKDGKLRFDRFDPKPAIPVTRPLLVTEGMRVYYTVANPSGLVYYTRQTNSSGTPPSKIYEGDLRTGKNRLVYEAPVGWQISQSCNLTNDGAFVFARIYNIKDNTDNRILRINVTSGATETIISPPFPTDHIHCSPFDNNWVLYCKDDKSYESLRMWAWHAAEAPKGRSLFSQKDEQGRSLYNGHEVAYHHRLGAATVVFRHSPGQPAGLYEINFDGTFRCVSPNTTLPAWHCNVSRDGRWAVIDTQEAGGVSHIYAVNFATGARQLLARTSATDHPWHPHPHISPDDKWVVFNDDAMKKTVVLELDQDWLARFASKQ